MADNSGPPSKRRPAVVVGGQRRRLTRRANLPHSSTMPVLGSESAAASSSSVGSLINDSATSRQEGATASTTSGGLATATPLQSSQSMLNFYPPTGLPANLDWPSDDAADALDCISPTPTLASPSTVVTDSRKKQGFFDNFKLKDMPPQDVPVSSPFPQQTPTKAAKFLGVPTGRQHEDALDGQYEDMPGPSGSKFKEEGITEPVKSKKSIWGTSKKKSQKIIPSNQMPLNPPPRRAPPPPPSASHQRSRRMEGRLVDRMAPIKESSYDNLSAAYYRGADDAELDLIEYYRQKNPPPAILPRSRTDPLMGPQDGYYSLEDEDCSPMEQADDGSVADGNGWEVHPGFPFASSSSREGGPAGFRRRSPLQHCEDRLLDAAEMALEAHKASQASQPHGEVDLKGKGKAKAESVQAPVRESNEPPALGDTDLDPIQAELDAYKLELDKSDARRLSLDAKVAAMKEEHEKMKAEFNGMKLSQTSYFPGHTVQGHGLCRNCGEEAAGEVGNDSEDDLVSIRSSIDLDEEPTVHVATAMPIIRVTPGMVKLVDIPPRKKRQSYTKDWVAAYDASKQRPVDEEALDDDVRRDREVPPAPLPK